LATNTALGTGLCARLAGWIASESLLASSARSTSAAVSAVAPDGLIRLERAAGHDERPAGHVDAAAGGQATRAAGSAGTARWVDQAVACATCAASAPSAPACDVAADDVFVQREVAPRHVDATA